MYERKASINVTDGPFGQEGFATGSMLQREGGKKSGGVGLPGDLPQTPA